MTSVKSYGSHLYTDDKKDKRPLIEKRDINFNNFFATCLQIVDPFRFWKMKL